MADGADGELPWWKQQMVAAQERKAREAERPACANPGDALLIVTEGTVTEPVYFEALKAELKLAAASVRIVPGDASDPRHVIRTAARLAEEQKQRHAKGELAADEPAKFEQVWAVIDTDVAVRKGIWSDVVGLAGANGVRLAHSTPCVEYWLLLHLTYTTRADLLNGSAAKRAVRDELGKEYSTNARVARRVIPAEFLPHWPKAVEHARRVRRYHLDAATPAPANPSTEVDGLVCAMNDAAPLAHRRRC